MLRNVVYYFIARMWLFVLTLATTPYVVSRLGIDAYGVFAIVSVIATYFSFLDLGLGGAVIKYVAEYHAKKDYLRLEKVIGTSITLYVLIGLAGAALIGSLTGLLVTVILKIPPSLQEASYFAFYAGAVGFFINMILNVFSSIPNALQRFDVLNKINVVTSTANFMAIVILLYAGFGLREVVLVSVVVNLISALIFMAATRLLLPGISFTPRFDLETARFLFKFGGFNFLNQISIQVTFELDKFLIGAFWPIWWISYYTVPVDLSKKLVHVALTIARPFFPAASELSSLELQEQFQEMYVRVMKLALVLMMPLAVMLLVFADRILLFWMGADFAEKSALSLRILIVAYLVGALSNIPALSADGAGKPELTALLNLVSAAFSLPLALALIPRYGINGAAVAVTVPVLAFVPPFIHYVNHKILRLTTRELLRRSLSRPLLSGLVLLLIFLPLNGFVSSPVRLFTILAGGGLLYFLLTCWFGVWDDRDKQLMLAWAGRFLRKGKQDEIRTSTPDVT